MADLFTFTVKSAPEHRDDMLRTIRSMLIARGVSDPAVGPDSDFYVLATALSNELAVCGANNVIKADEQMPDTAEDDDEEGTTALSRIAGFLGLSKRAASGSVGHVIFDATAASAITVGANLTDQYGQTYSVDVGGTYSDGDLVPISAVSTGKGTNLPEGSVLKWSGTSPAYSAPTALVSTGGLVNGADAETNDELRARIFAFFQNPPAAGNWSHCAKVAVESTSRVQAASVYPAVQGAGTVHIAVTASPTATNKSRVVAPTVMNGTVEPYVVGILVEHVDVTITSVADVNADLAIGLTLPEAPTASPPGPGGGWLNGTPWPAPDGSSSFRAPVTAVTSTTVFSVEAATAPQAGVTRIAWLSPTDWKLHRAKVTAVGAPSGGSYPITIDTPFTGIAVGCLIWPDCQNAQTYVDAVIATFATMGPGEKTSNVTLIVRGFRHPRPITAYPYTLGPHFTNALVKISEVASAQFLHRTDGTTTLTGASGTVSPQLPAAITDAPNVFVPRHIAFYRIP